MQKGDEAQRLCLEMSGRLRMALSFEKMESYEAVAEFFDLPVSTIKNWLNGNSMPPALSIKPLFDRNWRLDWLYYNRGLPREPEEQPKQRSAGMRVAGGVA